MSRILNWIFLGVFFGAPLNFAQDSKPLVDIPEAEAAEHRIGTRGPIYTNDSLGQQHLTTDLTAILEVLVGTDGKVVSARKIRGSLFADVTYLAKTWEYKPFERDGHPVAAKVRESVAMLPIGERPQVQVSFPEIHDWSSLRITLARSACYGMCPIYDIEIHGDGNVLYGGKAYVGAKGERKVKISHASLVKLMDVFRKSDYFSLADGYVAAITDSPTYASSISFDGLSKSVLDYVGQSAGMPKAVSELESVIDQLSGASKLVGGK